MILNNINIDVFTILKRSHTLDSQSELMGVARLGRVEVKNGLFFRVLVSLPGGLANG